MFDSVLAQREDLCRTPRERVLDWWASALDREVRPRPEIERQDVYRKVRERMRAELGANPASAVASYWLAAAARAQGDLQAAWDAAQAGWVRAPLASDRGAALRGDLDRLVQRAIAPDRAKALAQPPDAVLLDWESSRSDGTDKGYAVCDRGLSNLLRPSSSLRYRRRPSAARRATQPPPSSGAPARRFFGPPGRHFEQQLVVHGQNHPRVR